MSIPYLDDLRCGRIGSLSISAEGQYAVDAPPYGPILSGSFNPLHAGHRGMSAAAATICGAPTAFELPLRNADKGELPGDEVIRRARQFQGWATLILSCAPFFAQKARLYPGRTLVLGYDTAARLLDPAYYGGVSGLCDALDQIRAAGCRLLVAGRLVHGRFHTLADLNLPSEYVDLVRAIPVQQFRMDISSTKLRR
ncbi:hypothetical protein [Candidatus Oscillochloris fontis]|uniref:hypothetical protein n=1 Tax=Candidatus Oscillochloris fontis TaxID=2496868 RepID=UPI00101BF2D2|nr:hypothetical protein [Candidatus Oscillochloris fontis]